MSIENFTNEKITIYSHYETTGACEELRDWLKAKKARKVVYVAFPFLRSRNKYIRVDQIENGEIKSSQRSVIRFKKPEAVSYAKDLIYGVIYGIRYAGQSALFVGGDNLLSLIGIVLKHLGLVRRVAYYMIDYTPVRFPNRLLNAAYQCIDRIAAYGVDYVWPLTRRMIEARFENGRLDPAKVNWFEVPYGSHTVDIGRGRPINRTNIAYMGGISKNKGAELFVPIAKELKSRTIEFKFTIIGDGEYMSTLKSQISQARLIDNFQILGFVENFNEAVRTLSSCGLAIAPYYPFDKNSFTCYADPGKLKVYLGCGLPIVLTDMPPIARLIEERGAGVTARYDAADFAAQIIKIITSPEYEQFRKNASKLGSQYEWDTIFREAFSKL